ncbi:HypC/HybG/HupF family hydrogenase formation chaperone [Fulvivirga sedimenti]|uniref:HypC/HybG/HupF family hydrogenase formation chaperone n=1 Tax=Fulvivirga sedimenti TaxID=2879465 RepID=A0A9X1HZB4_9BACT|nr:HypC/HybG/HupF family hydrogenase formation chaperone [Fulvivirga sedimenti]MCA6079199.1 HypC/HybG/HupF family hydrogenase formation chaperone [Fulvivirga sedimenti]
MCLAIPGKIIELDENADPAFRTGKVSFEGIIRVVNLSMVPSAGLNDYVLVHVGVALEIIDEQEAIRVFSYLKEVGEVDEELGITTKKEGP